MRLVPWKARETGVDIFQDLEDMQKQMNDLFNLRLKGFPAENGFSMPAVDIVDEKDVIRVRADIPGMKKEEIEVAVDNDVLTIKGEKKQEKEVKEKDYLRSERYYGAFHRSFTLPAAVDPQKVNASYKDGVLEVALPKREDAKPKQIKVDIK